MKTRTRFSRILPPLLAGLVAFSSAWMSQNAAAQTACTDCFSGTVGCNESVNGFLEDGDCALSDDTFLDVYSLTLTAPTTVTITLSSADFDSYLFLLDGFCNILAQNDDCVGVNSCLTQLLPAGTYYVGANSFDVETGSYTVAVSCPVPPSLSIVALANGDVQVDASVAGTLQSTTAFQGASTVWTSIGPISPASPYVTHPGPAAPIQFYRLTIP